MAFIWTPEGMFEFLSALPLLYAYYTVRKLSRLFQSPALQYMQYSWLSFVVYLTCSSASFFFHDPFLYKLRLVLFVPVTIFMELSLNLIENDRIKPLRFGLCTAICGAMVLLSFSMDSYETIYITGGYRSFNLLYPTYLVFMICIAWLSGSYVYFSFLIYRKAPENYRNVSRANFGVMSIGTFLIFVSLITEFNKVLIGIDVIILGLIVMISVWILNQYPKLFFLLTRNPIKLVVMEMESGNHIFTYDWGEDGMVIPTQLFAAALESIHIFVDSSLNRGKMAGLTLEEAEIIIHHDKENSLSFILFAGEASYIMKRSFESFIDLFKETNLHNFRQGNIIMVDNSESLNQLVETVF